MLTSPSRAVWRRLASSCRREPRLLAMLVLSSIGGTGLEALGPLLVGISVGRVAAGDDPLLNQVATALIALAVVQFGAEFTRRYSASKLALAIQHRLRGELFAAVQRRDGAQQDELRTGQAVSRAGTDLQQVQVLLGMLPIPIGVTAQLVVAVVAMLWLSVPLALVVLVILPAMVLVVARSRHRIGPLAREAQVQAGVIAEHVEQAVGGMAVVTGFGQEVREGQRLRREAGVLYAVRVRLARLQAKFGATMSALPLLGQAAILALGGWLALRGTIGVGTFVAFAGYVVLLTGPSRLLANFIVTAQQARPAAERVFEIIDDDPRIVEDPAAPSLPGGPLAVSLHGVEFAYAGTTSAALTGLDLDVAAGQTVAVVGPAGSGKSTFALLLSRVYDPTRGSVRLGGADLRAARLSSVRSAVATVMEDPLLLSGTIRDNIVLGSPAVQEDSVLAAASDAGLDADLAMLPDGLDTQVGEGGSRLSGGQRQRVALARALLSDPGVLVLDDATSALDATTEEAVLQALHRGRSQRTTVMVARRPSAVRQADHVVLLDAGRIVDSGTPDELAARNTLYRNVLGLPVNGGLSQQAPGEDGVTAALWPDSTDQATLVGPEAGGFPDIRVPEVAQAGRVSTGSVLRSCRGLLAGALALLVVDLLCGVSLPWLVQRGLDDGVRRGDGAALTQAVLLALLVIGIGWLAFAGQTRLSRTVGERVLMTVRVRSFDQIGRLGVAYTERNAAGALMTRVVNDVDVMAMFLQGGMLPSVTALATLAGVGVALLLLNPLLGLAALSLTPLVAIGVVRFYRLSGAAYDEARARIGAVNAGLQEQVRGVRTVQAFSAEERSRAHVEQLSETYRAARLRAQKYASVFFPSIRLLAELSRVILLVVGVRLIQGGSASVGDLTAALLYLGMFFGPLQQLSQAFDSYQQAAVGWRRVGQLLATPQPVLDRENAAVATDLAADLVLDSVHYSYPDGADALSDVELQVRPGETVAVVGPTGSGKSTLIKLAVRFYDPSAGAVRVGGRDITDWTAASYRRRIGYVPQEPYLFDRDIAENIRYGSPDATDAQVEQAARHVGALALVAARPMGFRAPVGPGGSSLSAGERQLIALARAELVRPDILLLDEATAALDGLAERAVATAARQTRRTTVVIAHRLSTAAAADRVIVLRDGRVVQQGGHAELVETGGWYAEAWRAQTTGTTG